MVDINKLIEIRKTEAEKLKKINDKLKEKEKIKKIKEDIKKIKSAKLRSSLGINLNKVKNIENRLGNAFKGGGKVLKNSFGQIGKGLMAASYASNDYYINKKRKY